MKLDRYDLMFSCFILFFLYANAKIVWTFWDMFWFVSYPLGFSIMYFFVIRKEIDNNMKKNKESE